MTIMQTIHVPNIFALPRVQDGYPVIRALTADALECASGGANFFGLDLDFQSAATVGGFGAFAGGIGGLGGGPLGVAVGAFAGFAGGFVGDLGVQIYAQWVELG